MTEQRGFRIMSQIPISQGQRNSRNGVAIPKSKGSVGYLTGNLEERSRAKWDRRQGVGERGRGEGERERARYSQGSSWGKGLSTLTAKCRAPKSVLSYRYGGREPTRIAQGSEIRFSRAK